MVCRMKASDLYKKHGIPTRRIQFYVEKGAVGCVDNPGRGSVGRTFSRDNELELLLVDELSNRCGMEFSRILRLMKMFRELRITSCDIIERYIAKKFPDHDQIVVIYDFDPELEFDDADRHFSVFYSKKNKIDEFDVGIKAGCASCVVVNMSEILRRI